ncbi:hypothetical protein ISCGN_004121 [Ixodes scapularis]|uniref:Uncharacterized protein n=1 Tax=Ixodes scapularis TaxID=6945 RepID=B7PC40_IXOSC|nr:hypothetical protein IscW_ISCW001906 [Ixodes scapularis]|eukprot:XP_002409322.1 hypothetical protein IscW_ISCW001906 [Ixodes scapularis]
MRVTPCPPSLTSVQAGRSSSSRGLPFLRAMPYRVAQVRSGPHRNRYPGYRLAGQQLSPGARCPVVQDDPPCYLDALKCPLAQTHQHKSRDVETPPPAYEAVS